MTPRKALSSSRTVDSGISTSAMRTADRQADVVAGVEEGAAKSRERARATAYPAASRTRRAAHQDAGTGGAGGEPQVGP